MPTVPLPENPSLEHLRSQAKLVRDLIRSEDPGAMSMIDEFHPRLDAADVEPARRRSFKTADAQLIVARMYRFASWRRLREHLAVVASHSFTPAAETGAGDHGESFVTLACLDYAEDGPSPADRIAEAHRRLLADPTLATGSIAAVATVGDHQALSELLDERPEAVNGSGGPNGWPPLLYATYSRIATDNREWSAVETVKLLLDRGADPNAGFLWRGLVPPFTALTGAFGGGESHQARHPDRLAIARLLLEAGADPNDGQALYNNGIGGQNHDDPAHLELLIEYGLGTHQGGPWYRRLGDQLADPAELLYGELEAAAARGRPAIFRFLVERGLDVERAVGRSGQTPARLAAANGHHEILAILADLGVDAVLQPVEQFLDDIRHDRSDDLRELLATNPGLDHKLLADQPGAIKNVVTDGEETLELLIQLGFDVNARTGGSGTTALHEAAQADDVELTRLLIERGADPNVVDIYVGSTPWGWANHFHHRAVADYLRPLTEHDDPPATIVVSLEASTRIVASPPVLDRTLDEAERRATEPALVRLEGGGASLSIGIGRPDASLALYLDPAGKPWHAVGSPGLSIEEPLTFARQGQRWDFEPAAALSRQQARAIAHSFSNDPGAPPAGAEWEPEGPGEPPPPDRT